MVEKPSLAVVADNPLYKDLVRVGLVPAPSDPWSLTPNTEQYSKEEKRQSVAGRISPQARRLLTEIVESGAVPGVGTVSEAVSAAVTFWIEVVLPRLRHSGFVEDWKLMRTLKRHYDGELARIHLLRSSDHVRGAAEIMLAREDRKAAAEVIKDAWAVMEDLWVPRCLEFQRRVLKGATPALAELWGLEQSNHPDLCMAIEDYVLPQPDEEEDA